MDVLAILAALSGGVLVGIGATIAFAKYGNLTTAMRNAEKEVYVVLDNLRIRLEAQIREEVQALHARLDEVDDKQTAERGYLWQEVRTIQDTQKEQAVAKAKKVRRKPAAKRQVVRVDGPTNMPVTE